MKNKILVIVYVPLIEKEYNIYIPNSKKLGVVKELIIEMVERDSDGTFVNDGYKNLYDKSTGKIMDDNEYIKKSSICNGTKLFLY